MTARSNSLSRNAYSQLTSTTPLPSGCSPWWSPVRSEPDARVLTASVNDCGGGGGDCGDDLVVVVNATKAYSPSPLLHHRNRRLRMKVVLAGSVKSPANITFVVRAAIAAVAAVLREDLVLVATTVVMMAEPVDGLSVAIAAPAAARHRVRADSWRMRRRRQRWSWRKRWGGGELGGGCVVNAAVW